MYRSFARGFALASVASLSAQAPTFATGELTSIPVTGVQTSSFRMTVAGHLTGFFVNDAVILADTRPILMTAPGVHRSAIPLPGPSSAVAGFDITDVRAMALLPGGGQPIADGQNRDALVLVTGAGMWKWYTEREDILSPPATNWYYRAVSLGAPVWSGATRLRTADVDGDGDHDVLGLMANGTSIRCYVEGGEAWVIDTCGRVDDFCVGDFESGGTPEIAVLVGPITDGRAVPFSGGVCLFAPATTAPFAEIELPHSVGSCTALPGTFATGIAVACDVGGDYAVTTLLQSHGAMMAIETQALSGMPTAMIAARWRHSHADLLLTLANSGNPIEVVHDGALGLTQVNTIPITNSNPGDNMAWPLVADFHGDPTDPTRAGAPKLVYPQKNAGVIAVQHEVLFPAGFPTLVAAAGSLAEIAGTPAEVSPGELSVQYCAVDLTTGALVPSSAGSFIEPLSWNAGGKSPIHLTLPAPTGSSGWMLAMRFTSGSGTVRWPMRACIVQPQGGVDESHDLLMSLFGLDYCPLLVAMNGAVGITGDVVQPPTGPGTGDVPPPKP